MRYATDVRVYVGSKHLIDPGAVSRGPHDRGHEEGHRDRWGAAPVHRAPPAGRARPRAHLTQVGPRGHTLIDREV
jgi:hypothetical protein